MVASEIERLYQSDRMLQLDRLMASLSTIPMTANSFRLFSAKLRTLIIEDVTNVERSRCSIWDDFFAILFVYSFRFSSPSACWPRICRTLILQDALDPMSTKGIVRNLIDRYFGIFNCVHANEISNLDPFIQTWVDPSTNQQNTLGFDTSFLHTLSIVPVGWGLLHHAAHSASQDMIIKLVDYGAEVGTVDADKRHALHIAAASLNLDVIDYLSDNSRNSFIYDVDIYGKTPLDLLLEASALSNWVDRVTPLRLFTSVIKLLGVSQNLWSNGGDHHIDDSKEKDDDTNKNKIISETVTAINTNKFYSILYNVRGCDDIVALKIIDVARSCSNYLWDVSIIMQSIILSVRQRRYQLLKNLLEAFHEKLFTHFQYSNTHVTIGLNSMQVEGYFLQYCLTTAVQNKSSVRIISLIIQYMTLQFSGRSEFYLKLKDTIPITDIINIAVMRCASLDRTVLTPQELLKKASCSIPSDMERVKKFTETLIDNKKDLRSDEEEMEVLEILLQTFSTSSVLHPCGLTATLSLSETFGDEINALNLLNKSAPLWSQFSDENDMRNQIRSFSPLSLACFMGSTTTLQTLLKNISKPASKPRESNANASTGPLKGLVDDCSSPGGSELESKSKIGFGFEEAVMCAVLSSSPECLLILKEHMGAELFSQACVQSDDNGVSPLQALLHFVKVRALHRIKIQNRVLGPSSPSDAFLTFDLKLEKITQTLNVLLNSQEEEKEGGGKNGGGGLVNCVSEEQRVDILRNTVSTNEKSRVLSARIELIDRRLTAVCDGIILASTPASTVLFTPTHDTTIPLPHSCPPLPVINRINNESSILFLNKSMNNILDYNEENDDTKNKRRSKSSQQIMKSTIKKEEKFIPKNVLLDVPIQRPTFLSLLETTNYFDAEKDFLESNKQWSKLQLQLGTPSGTRKFFIRMRLFLRAVTPDNFTLLLAQCIASLLEDGKTVPHTGLPLRVMIGIDKLKVVRGSVEDKSYSNIQSTINSPEEKEGEEPSDIKSKSTDGSPAVSFPSCADLALQCISDPLLSWKKLAVISGIRLRPNPFSRQDKTFQLFCSNLLALSNPLQSRVNSNSNLHGMKNIDIMSQDAQKKTYSEVGRFILSKEKWEEVSKMFLELKNIKKSNEKKGLSSGSKFRWTMDFLFGYIQRVVRDGELLYSTGDSILGEGRSGRECALMYIELASLVYCRNNLNEILPLVRDVEDRSSVPRSLRDRGSSSALSTLLSYDPFPPSLTRLLLSYTNLIAEATASGTVSLSSSAARIIGCAPLHTVIGGRRLPIDADALAVLDACVHKLASSTGSYSQVSNCVEYTPADLCKDDDIKLKSLETFSMTLFNLACAGRWEAAKLILNQFASGILSNSGSRIHHSHLNPFQSCHVESGNNVLEALQSCAASVTPFAPSSLSIPSGVNYTDSSSLKKDGIPENYTDFASHSKLYGLCSLHYAAVEGNFHFIQTALDLFETAVIPVRLIIDIMLLTQLNNGNMKEKEKEIPATLLMSLVSRADLDPRSMPSEEFLNIFIRENESQQYRAAVQSIYAAYTIAENHDNPIVCYDNKSMGLICPQYAGQLQGLCIRMGLHNKTNYSATASKQYLLDHQRVRTPTAEHPLRSKDISPYRSTATYVCMMDGSSLPLQDFFSDINNLFKALPAPQVALGTGHTGDTFLHEAARCTDPGLLNMLIKDFSCVNTVTAAVPLSDNSETHANTLKGVCVLKSLHSNGTAFAMNQDGATPIYLALLAGHVATVNDILARSTGRPPSTNHNNSSLRIDNAKDNREVVSNRVGVVKTQTQDVICKSGQTMGSISYRDTLLSPIDLSGICADPRSPPTHTNTKILSLFLNAANLWVDKAEKELMKITKISLPMEASVDVLKLVLDRALNIQKEISSTDFTVFTQLSYTSAGYVLDSLVRAKKILKLLGIPYSEIGASCESSIKSQKTSQSSGYTPDILGQQNSKNCLDSRNLKATGVRGLLSQSVASEIKMLLAEWYGFRLESPGFDSFHSALRRCTDSASLSETLMLFHRLDVSVMSMGVLGGQGIGSKIRDERAKNAKASKSTSPKEPSNWWSSSSPSSSFSPPPARMRSDVDGRKRESRKLQPLNKIPPQDLEGTSHSSYESPHALPRYVSLEIRNRSQWNQSHSSSYFSFSTPYHSDIFSLPSPQSKDMYKSSIPSNLYAIEMEESSRCKEMEAFMELWILDPRSVKEALRLSYLILEYARLLVVARGMATMTSDDVRTSESTGAGDVIPVVEHPLDRWRNELNAANIYKKEVLDVSSINASLSAPPLPPSNVRIDATVSASVDTLSDRRWNSMGMRSKFPSLNRVSASDLYSFLYPKKELNNKQLGDSRDRLLQCILLLLLSTRKEKTAESASRIVRGFLSATSSPSDGVKDRPQGLQNRTTAVLQKHLHRVQVIGNKDSTANKRKDIEKQKNDCSIVLNSLKELCVSDVCYSNGGDNLFNSNNTDNQYGHRNGVSTTNKAYRKEIEQEKEKYLVHFEKACDDLFGTFPLSSRSKEYPKESESHFVAMALMDFIKCVRGVYRQRSLYRIDIHSWMGVVKNNCNPLCALLSLPSHSKYITWSRNHKLELTNKDEKKRDDERQLECCRLLLRTGVSAFYQDKTGRIPVVTVALGGDDNGPSMLLEMLSYLSSDDYSNDNSSSSSSNSSSYRDSVRDMNDQNLKPGTTPVPVRTHRYRILEGDDFKFLVWHVLMGCPGRDTSPSSIPIPCDTQIEEGNEGKYVIDSDKQDKNKVIDMSIPKRTTEKMNNATKKLLYAEYARRNRVQVAILSILLDCGFPVCQPKDAYFSCLDLAAMKMIPWGMLQFIERVEFKIQDAPKKEITRIPLANITSKTSSSSSISYFNFNSSFSQSPPQYIIHASPVTPSPDLRFPARTPFKAVHFMLLSLGLSPNLALDCHNNKTKENNSSPLSFLTPLLDKTFNRLTVPGALPMSDMLPYTDIAFDLHTHAVYLTKHSRAPSSYPSYRPKATAAASIDVSVQPCSSVPVPLLSVDETVSEFLESAKNILADSLESFFPTPHTKSTRIYHTTTLCPFWFAARTSIRALRHTPYTPYKSPLMDGPGHLSKNTMFKDIEDDDVNMDEEISKNIPQDVTSSSTWNILHLAVRTGRVDVFRYLLNLPQVPGPKSADDGYLGGVQQLLKGRKVTVNKASLCLCACYYNKPECLDILRSYQYFHAKIPADGIRRDSFLTLSKSPKKRLALPITRAPILHLSPETEFKLSSKLHFEPSNREYSLLDLSAYIGNEDCFCYLLQSTDSKYTEEDITAVWSTIVTCMRRGCLSEACLLLAVTWVLERVTKADLSVLDDANDSVHLDDFDTDDAAEENKKESVLSLACTLKAVIVPTPDMMRFPNRYRNRKGVGVVRVSSVLSTESGVITLNDEKEEEKVDSSAHLFQETVLHLSCRRGLLLIVRVLLQYGANPHVRDSTGWTPWEVAVCAGHSSVTALIGEYIPANGRVHTAVLTIAKAIRCYLKNKNKNKGSEAQ